MKVVVGNRGSDVTTNMLLDASRHAGTIVTTTVMSAQRIKDKCKWEKISCPNVIDIYTMLNDINNGKTEQYDNAQLYIDNAGLVLNELLNRIGIKGKVVEISLSMDGIGN